MARQDKRESRKQPGKPPQQPGRKPQPGTPDDGRKASTDRTEPRISPK